MADRPVEHDDANDTAASYPPYKGEGSAVKKAIAKCVDWFDAEIAKIV